MRKRSLAALLFLITSNSAICYECCFECDDYTSQSFMFTRPITQNLAAHQSAWHNIVHDRHGTMLSALQVIGLFQQSMADPKTAQYFLFNNKCALTVMGDNAPGDIRRRDIRAEWVNLPSDFLGSFSICPKQNQVGLVLEFNQMLKKLFSWRFFDFFWVSVIVPIVAIENDLNFRQFDIRNARTGYNGEPRDICEAFNQRDWHYAKLSNANRSKIGLENLRVAFGTNYASENNFQMSYYSHLTFPAGGKDPACYLFDSVLGNNGHVGIGAGVSIQFVTTRPSDSFDVCFYLDLEHTFMIRSNQKRTVDLINKPWSRYLPFNSTERGPDANIPGVNILTREFKVRPYSMVDFAFGFRIKRSDFELEVGYGIWGRSNEKLDELTCPFPEIYGIAGVMQDGDTEPRTASESTISQYEATTEEAQANDYEFIPIQLTDLDFESGVSRSAINHRAHIAFSKLHKGKKIDGTFCIGAFYEYPQYNSSLQQWGLWGKMGASF